MDFWPVIIHGSVYYIGFVVFHEVGSKKDRFGHILTPKLFFVLQTAVPFLWLLALILIPQFLGNPEKAFQPGAVRFINEKVFFWLFSTIAQTLGAVVGVGAMVAVYRMGQLRDGRWNILQRLSEFSFMVTGNAAPSALKLLEVWKSVLDGSKTAFKCIYKKQSVTMTVKANGRLSLRNPNNRNVYYENKTNVRADLSELDRIVEDERQFRKSFFHFLKVNLLIIGCSVGALLFSKVLIPIPLVLIITIYITAVAICLSLIKTLNFCKKLMPPWSEQEDRDNISRQTIP